MRTRPPASFRHDKICIRYLRATVIVAVYVVIFAVFPAAGAPSGISVNHPLTQKLSQNGFENIAALSTPKATLLTFENMRYRHTIRGLETALLSCIATVPQSTNAITIVIQKYNIPVASLSSRRMTPVKIPSTGRTLVVPKLAVSDNTYPYWKFLRRNTLSNPSKFKLDIILLPEMRAVLGNYDNPFALQLNIVPELRTMISPGLIFSSSFIVPLYNELDDYGDHVRLGPTNLNLFRALPNNWWLFLSAGSFREERYGLQGMVRKLVAHGRIAIDIRSAYSGYSIMDRGVFLYDPLNTLTWSCETTLFLNRLQLFLTGGVHQYLNQDRGFRVDILRFFGQLGLDIWGGNSNDEWNGGFRLYLPLPPSRYPSRGRVRLRMADYFTIGYQGRRETINGAKLSNSMIMDDIFIRSHPLYLSSTLKPFLAR